MKNRWSDAEAASHFRCFARTGAPKELGLRVYSSRLLGGEKSLVLHGGGNTSVKVERKGAEVLYVKGSGHDMGDIGPDGFTPLDLAPLRGLKDLDGLSDDAMLDAFAAARRDRTSPAPSVETFLHAFLPHAYVDHTHANAVLALSNRADGEKLCKRVFGKRAAIVPYAMSGFDLAKQVSLAVEVQPDVDGVVLLRHGLFTFGASAKEAYGRMIDLVSLAEKAIRKTKGKTFAAVKLPTKRAGVAEVAPVIRGLAALSGDEAGDHDRFILDFRTGKAVRAFVDGRELGRYATAGTATPDHVIRTKAKPLILPPPEAGRLDNFSTAAGRAMTDYEKAYGKYFARNNRRHGGGKTMLDPKPRVVLVPGLGLFGLGRTVKEAGVAADLAECAVEVISATETSGRFEGASEADLFDIEYWAPEQAKVDITSEQPLLGQVCAVTGGASGIGLATARTFAEAGAAVAVLDLDEKAAVKAAGDFGAIGLGCDVADKRAVGRAMDRIVETYGGLDIVVSNAGAAWQGRIGDVDEKVLRKSFELNFWGHQNVAQAAVQIMTAQGTGGCLLFNTSKQAVNPGRNFGPYGLPKAATLFLMKQYALDHGGDGIRSNAVNADRIRSGLLTADMIASRSKARGVSEADYMAGNLLGREVTADDVATAFLHLALARTTTAAVLTVDGGNIEASLR